MYRGAGGKPCAAASKPVSLEVSFDSSHRLPRDRRQRRRRGRRWLRDKRCAVAVGSRLNDAAVAQGAGLVARAECWAWSSLRRGEREDAAFPILAAWPLDPILTLFNFAGLRVGWPAERRRRSSVVDCAARQFLKCVNVRKWGRVSFSVPILRILRTLRHTVKRCLGSRFAGPIRVPICLDAICRHR